MTSESLQLPTARIAEAGLLPAETAAGLKNGEALPETQKIPAAQTAEIVNEIRDIADGLWALERDSVEVRFHFGDSGELAVRVEYRDGEVRTTFRTASPELRDTLATEWQHQAAASEQRPYRVADPVFTAQPAGEQRQASLGSDVSSQQQQHRSPGQEAQQQPGAPAAFSFSRSAQVATPSPVAARTLRPDTAKHLHVLA
jgi:hypothetical protein